MAIYRQYAEKLVDNGFAYYAFDSEVELDALRKQMEAEKSAFSYNSKTRKQLVNSLTLSADEVEKRIHAGDSFVVRLQIPENEEVVVHDLIRQMIRWHSITLEQHFVVKLRRMHTNFATNKIMNDHFFVFPNHYLYLPQ